MIPSWLANIADAIDRWITRRRLERAFRAATKNQRTPP
jgi:hypothetical protein